MEIIGTWELIMDEYIPITEFCRLTGYKKQTIYNKIHKKELQLGKHYVKPTRKKILFKRGPIRKWLEGEASPAPRNPKTRETAQSRICIQESLPFSSGSPRKKGGPDAPQ